jgi:DNA-directed RNA polymerase II subunit RPB4
MGVKTMTLPEIKSILKKTKQERVQLYGETAINEYKASSTSEGCRVFRRTLDHADKFARYHQDVAIVDSRSSLERAPKLEQFEIAQIINLCPKHVDEAKSLIPSLMNKISDEVLQDLLYEQENLRRGQLRV